MCLHVLHTAARHSDTDLAADVFRVLGNRGRAFEAHEYEALLETYAGSGDYQTALTILTLMKDAGHEPPHRSTRSILQCITKDKERVSQALRHLKTMVRNKRTIPTASINCIIEGHLLFSDIDGAEAIYRELRTICTDGPTTQTFDLLIGGCERDKSLERALFFARDMRALKLRPTPRTYEGLIAASLRSGDISSACMYYRESKEGGYRLRPNLCIELVRSLASARDERAMDVAEDVKELRVEKMPIVRWLKGIWARNDLGRIGLPP